MHTAGMALVHWYMHMSTRCHVPGRFYTTCYSIKLHSQCDLARAIWHDIRRRQGALHMVCTSSLIAENLKWALKVSQQRLTFWSRTLRCSYCWIRYVMTMCCKSVVIASWHRVQDSTRSCQVCVSQLLRNCQGSLAELYISFEVEFLH